MSGMTGLECPACGNPSRDGGLCDRDEATLADVLKHAPEILDELQIQTARLNVAAVGGGRQTERPLPINLRAADLAATYEALLLSWSRACAAYGDPSLPETGRTAAHWLAERIYDIRIHEAAGDLVTELASHAKDCWRAVDRFAADTIWIGNCSAIPPDNKECRTPLRVRPGKTSTRCPRCEEPYDVAEMLAARDAIIDDKIFTIAEIAKMEFKLPDGRVIGLRMIEGYVARRRLEPAGWRKNEHRDKDIALYRIGEVKQAARDAHGLEEKQSA